MSAAPPHQFVPPGRQPGRKRSSRACDGCKQRRMKCEDVLPHPSSGEPTCKLCREAGGVCAFETPVRKRGPAPGFRRQKGTSGSPRRDDSETETVVPRPYPSGNGEGSSRAPAGHVSDRPAPSPRQTQRGVRRRPPLLGLPPVLVDELLAVYFTHVHNVWPIIYKPMFNPHTASAPLLLSLLAIASCVMHPSGKDGLDGDKLFAMAETALHHCRDESRIDILQALMVLSLRQTGCGDKRSAFAYAGRASCMALNLGLHLAPTGPADAGDHELRSRVYWNAYVLDKILAEETGRPFLLSYRRSSTPLPNVNEADEFETWPPQTASSAPLPRTVRHVVPRRSYILSFFVWTTRLAMIVEDILDLDVIGPPVKEQWDRQFAARCASSQNLVDSAEDIWRQLQEWRRDMPLNLEVDSNQSVCPLPHHVVGLAWYHCVKILLFSRFIKRHPSSRGGAELAERAHSICSSSSEACVDLLAQLDRHQLLAQVSSDVVHVLSTVTLFEAFDASDPDEALAHRAKVNFAQCCIWLRDFSASWPVASAHKLFFEGLIQGGLKLSSGEITDNAVQPAGTPDSPSMPESLARISRHLGPARSHTSGSPVGRISLVSTPSGRSSHGGEPGERSSGGDSDAGPNLFQLPQFYWNHLTTAPMAMAEPSVPDPSWEWDVEQWHNNVAQEMPAPQYVTPEYGNNGMYPGGSGQQRFDIPQSWDQAGQAGPGGGYMNQSAGPSGYTGRGPPSAGPSGMPPPNGGVSTAPPGGAIPGTNGAAQASQADQANIYAALMSYMVQAAKT